jgi:hypothetical protein
MSSEDMSVTIVQQIYPGHLEREPNVSTNEYLDDYGILQDVNEINFEKRLKQSSQNWKKLRTALTEILIRNYDLGY